VVIASESLRTGQHFCLGREREARGDARVRERRAAAGERAWWSLGWIMMPKSISKEELLKDLERVADELGKSPTGNEYNEKGKFCCKTIRNKIGWNEAKEKLW